MPPTLRDLLRADALGLVVRAGEESLDRPISWVHTSELVDPAPFLSGGEFLLTTGQFVDKADPVDYVKRLVAAKVAGLGFGVGLPHDHTPPELIDAAGEAGLPLLEVPLATPFIAISQMVSAAITTEENDFVRHTHEVQRALTRAAVGRDGVTAVGRLLARELRAWVLILDAAGALVLSEPPSSARWVAGLGDVLDRLRGARAPASAAFPFGDDEVVLQSLGSGPRVRGFLAAGRATPFDEAERQLLHTTVSLLTLGLEQSHALDTAERQLRAGVFRLLQVGQLGAARPIAREISGGLPRDPLRLVALSGHPEAQAGAIELLKSEATRLRELVFYAEIDDLTVAAVTDGRPFASWLLELPQRVDGLSLGLSDAAGYDHFAAAHRQAVQAAEAGLRDRKSVTRFADLGQGGLAEFMDPKRAQTFAAALLEPLVRHDQGGRGDLVNSVRVWLEHHGQWDPAAARLGVHRHTLRHRIRKAEDLLGRPLDSPTIRAELWMALQIHENHEP